MSNDIYGNTDMLDALAVEAQRKLKDQHSSNEEREEALDEYNLENVSHEDNEYVPDDLYTVDGDDDTSHIDDVNEIFPGGPTDAQVAIWKRSFDGCLVFATEISGELFVARSITRLEYKKLLSLNVDQLQREEIICSTCCLYPYAIDWKDINRLRGGIPSTLATIVMEHSGFSTEYGVQVL